MKIKRGRNGKSKKNDYKLFLIRENKKVQKERKIQREQIEKRIHCLLRDLEIIELAMIFSPHVI